MKNENTLVNILDVFPNLRNARAKVSNEDVEKLRSENNPMMPPVTIKDGTVLSGHMRFKAGLDAGHKVKVNDIGTGETYFVAKTLDNDIVRVQDDEPVSRPRRPGPR